MSIPEQSPSSRIVLDLDGTLTHDAADKRYPDKPARVDVIAAARRAAEHLALEIHTARGMNSRGGDVEAIVREVLPGIEAWLSAHLSIDVPVRVGKPWPGPEGFYVDDRALSPETFVYRYTGPLAGRRLRSLVRVPARIDPILLNTALVRLERLAAFEEHALVLEDEEFDLSSLETRLVRRLRRLGSDEGIEAERVLVCDLGAFRDPALLLEALASSGSLVETGTLVVDDVPACRILSGSASHATALLVPTRDAFVVRLRTKPSPPVSA